MSISFGSFYRPGFNKPSGKPNPINQPPMSKRTPFSATQSTVANANRAQLKPGIRFGMNQTTVGGYPFNSGDIQLGTHPNTTYLNQLHDWERKIWHEATKARAGFKDGWLQPMDTLFQMSNQVDLMEAAARSGFPTRYRHWTWGQDFNDQYQRQRFGLGRLYEMVINTNPSYAFLYDRNPVHAQKVVMAHVLGHTDFFKNNIMFSESNRNMVRVMANNKAAIEKYYQDPRLSRKAAETGVHPVEAFLNKFNTLEWLVDMNALAPPPLSSEQPPEKAEDDHYKHAGMSAKKMGLAPWMQGLLHSHQEWESYRNQVIDESDQHHAKVLKRPTRDVLGFMVENAPNLPPWQRDMLGRLREESYYFVPQVRTKLMNEGWATFWHHKLMTECGSLANESETTDIAQMMAGVEAPHPNGVNPYQVGYAIFKNIYQRAALGMDDFDTTFTPNKVIRYEEVAERLKTQQPNEQAGIQKVKEVRKWCNDIEFIRHYFTPEVAEELGMVLTKEKEEWDNQSAQRIKVKYVDSDDFKQVKEAILGMYQNAFPVINLVDANHNNQGELLLKHENPVQDLNLADTQETLSALHEFWGRPVNLDTIFEVETEKPTSARSRHRAYFQNEEESPSVEFKRQPVRLTYQNGAMRIHTLNKQGIAEKDITDRYF